MDASNPADWQQLLFALVLQIERIPATFWGVIIGSFFTILSVAITNQANMTRLHRQLTHERELRLQERDFALRRDIYLEVAVAIGKASQTLTQMAEMDIEEKELAERSFEASAALAKVHVIASEETAQAISHFLVGLTESMSGLYPQRLKLKIQKNNIASKFVQLTAAGNESAKWIEHMRQYNLEGRNDPAQWQVIQETFDLEHGRHATLIKEHEEMQPDYLNGIFDLSVAVSSAMLESNERLVPVIVAARKELGVPIDAERYGDILRKAGNANRDAYNALLEQLRKG